ncbi:MAG: flagellar hook-associated protein FlgL [Rhodocyclaceae bacterium]|nr:flagellar hook-associated protein FlgL [Rhodocyclaceae bacterium]
MRVSSAMIYDAGLASIQKQTSSLLHTQQQLGSGRRILTPADDPVAAARALEVEQSRDTNALYRTNQKAAGETLGLVEANLAAVGELVHHVRALAVQGGNGALADRDRQSIAADLRQRFDALVGLANATDASGQHLFSGYMSGTTPFSGSVASGVTYAGDEGQRLLQVASSRQIAVSDSGNEVFMRIRNGNGEFATSVTAGNAGAGIIDAGTVTDPALWNGAGNNKDFSIVFAVSAGTTTYDIIDNVSGNSLLTGAAPAAAPYPRVFTPGQAIILKNQGAEPAFDFGARVVITGNPANGDSFDIDASSSQSLFATLGNLINALEAGTGAASGNTLLANRIGFALSNLDQAQDNLLRVRAAIGSRMNEIDALASAAEDLNINYEETLSRLRDVDYAAAVTELTQQQTYLEAAQKSFLKVSGLSLFNYV